MNVNCFRNDLRLYRHTIDDTTTQEIKDFIIK